MKNISNWFIGMAFVAAINLQAQDRMLSLADALTLAEENNRELKAAKLEVTAAHEETSIAKASLLPAVMATGGYSYYSDRQVIFMPGAFAGNEVDPVVDVAVGGKNVFNGYVSLHQPIIDAASRRAIKASRSTESLRELDVKEQRANLVVEVSATYYRALLIRQSIELNRQSLARNMRSLADSRMLLAQGKSLKVDTLRNFIIVENLRTSLANLESQRDIVLLQLRQLLGIKREENLLLTDSLFHDSEARQFAAVESVYMEAIQSRPDIQKMKAGVSLNKTLLSHARAQRLPTVSLVGQYQVQAQADNRHFASYRWPKTSFVGLHASMPLFSGGRINARVRQSAVQLQTSVLRMEEATEAARTEIASLQSRVTEMMQRLSIQAQTVQAAEMNFRIVNARYQNGLSSRLELSDAELALSEARMNQLHLIYNLKITRLQLNKALAIL